MFFISFIKSCTDDPWKTSLDIASIVLMFATSIFVLLHTSIYIGIALVVFSALYARLVYREWKSVWGVDINTMITVLRMMQIEHCQKIHDNVPQGIIEQGQDAVDWFQAGVLAGNLKKEVDEKEIIMYYLKWTEGGHKID